MSEQADQRDETVAFTHDWYRGFLDRLQKAGYEFRTFDESVGSGDVLLRHDVDLSLEAATAMAGIEAERDVTATYCVMLSSPLYNPVEKRWRDHVRAIEALGHDVALHFSTHEYWGSNREPDHEAIVRRVGVEQSIFESVSSSPSGTVSFHIPPDWVLDRPFDGFRSTYAPEVFGDIGYRADSGGRWREEPPVVENLPETVQILTHPGLWGETDKRFEERVRRHVADSCAYAKRKAEREFFDDPRS